MRVDRRYVPLLLFGLVLVAPFLLRVAAGGPGRTAPGGPTLRLVIVSPHNEPTRREFQTAFSAWHEAAFGQRVLLDFRSYGGASEIVKFFEASRRRYDIEGTYKIDLVWGGGSYLFDQQLKKPGYLEGVRLPEALMRTVFPRADLGGVPLYDRSEPPSWFGTALSSFGIVYNKDVLRHLGLPEPKTWRDLTDPRYRDWIALADPTRSSSAKQAFMVIVERAMADASERGRSEDAGWADGMGLIRLIVANARVITDSAGLVPALVSGGEAAAGTAIDFYARSQIDAVGDERVGYVEPVNATIVNPDPIALVKGAEHRELALRFIEFVLGERGQRLWNTRAGAPGGPRQTALRRLPILPTLYDDPVNMTDRVQPFTVAAQFNSSARRERTFGVIGELIQSCCLDLLEELRDTRYAVPPRRGVDATLGAFPFDQREALARGERWRKAPPLERLRLQRAWRDEFRAEYRRLREIAR